MVYNMIIGLIQNGQTVQCGRWMFSLHDIIDRGKRYVSTIQGSFIIVYGLVSFRNLPSLQATVLRLVRNTVPLHMILRVVAVLYRWGPNMLLHDRRRHLRSICGILMGIVVSAKDVRPSGGAYRMFRYLLGERLVSTNGLATVKVAVHAGIGLVHHVGLVRTGSVGSRAGGV